MLPVLSTLRLRRSSPKDPFPVKKLGTSQWSFSSTWENIQDGSLRCLGSKAIQPLTFLYPADRGIGTVPTPISGFKIHRVWGD
ncbi:hypothetical protein TNCV_2120711 [Trichonephila clavipes]|nr:hypothetical protein TNCV_2120711 [Trichonephila clavipes]